jgi:hypothetical protein
MSNDARQDNIDRGTYIPPQIGQAMDRHVQQNMPAHLKKYVGPDKPAYIPKEIERQISQQMDRSMPGHLKSYTNAYVQQRIVQPVTATQPVQSVQTPSIAPHPPIPNLVRRDHSLGFGQQYEVDINPLPVSSQVAHAGNTPYPSLPQPPAAAAQQPTQIEDPTSNGYDFIMQPKNPQKISTPMPSIPGVNPKLSKIAIGAVGLLLIILVAHTILGSLNAPKNLPALISVAQDQMELIHLSTNTSAADPDISQSNQNFVATSKLAMTSSNANLIKYLTINRLKYNTKTLSLKISLSTDTALTNSEAAGTFNQDFVTTNTRLLNSYMGDINTAYGLTKGQKGRALLINEYKQAKLLIVQLNSTNSD